MNIIMNMRTCHGVSPPDRDYYEQGKHVVILILGEGLLQIVETGVNPRGRDYYTRENMFL